MFNIRAATLILTASFSLLLQACWSQRADFQFSLTPGSANSLESPSKLSPFSGFQCEPGSAASPAPALQKYTSIESTDRAKALIEGMVSNTAVSQEIINRLNTTQATAGIPSERSGQYERQSASSSLDQTTVNALFRVSSSLSSILRSNTTWLSQFAGSCALSNPPTGECLRTFVTRLLSIALSSPPAQVSVDELVATLQTHSSDWLEASMTYAFLSASAVNRVELGTQGSSSGWVNLSEVELANRLASVFWMRLPDPQLRTWANSGQIRSRYEEVLNYVFDHPNFDSMMENFAHRYLRLEETPEIRLDSSSSVSQRVAHYGLSAIGSTTEYSSRAREEALRFFMESVKKGMSFEQMFLSEESYASGPLATAQGVPSWTPGQPPNSYRPGTKAGLLTLSALHINAGTEKNHIRAGYKALKIFLCGSVPSPESANIDPGSLVIPVATGLSSSRERTALSTSQPVCTGCHSRINPIGFALGQIDPMGVFREEERIYNPTTNAYLGTTPIDASVSMAHGTQQIRASQVTQFAELLLETEIPQACFARHFFRHAFGRQERLNGEEACALRDVFARVKEPNQSLKESLKELARSNFFKNRFVGDL